MKRNHYQKLSFELDDGGRGILGLNHNHKLIQLPTKEAEIAFQVPLSNPGSIVVVARERE